MQTAADEIEVGQFDAPVPPGAFCNFDVNFVGMKHIPQFDLLQQHHIGVKGVKFDAANLQRLACLLFDPAAERRLQVLCLKEAERYPDGNDQCQQRVEEESKRKTHADEIPREICMPS